MEKKCFPKKSVRQKFSDLRNYVKCGCYSVMTSVLLSPAMVFATGNNSGGTAGTGGGGTAGPGSNTDQTARDMVNNFVSVIGTLIVVLGLFFIVSGLVKVVAGHAKEDGPSQDRGMYQTAAGVVLVILPIMLRAFKFSQYVGQWMVNS